MSLNWTAWSISVVESGSERWWQIDPISRGSWASDRPGIIMRVAWFGLGRFGAPMARCLLAAGHKLSVPDGEHARQATRNLLASGADVLSRESPVDAYVTCLRHPSEVEAVIRDLQAPYGPLFVDLSTGSPSAAAEFAGKLHGMGIRYVDAPVSGSIESAGSGDLTTWVGATNVEIDGPLRMILESIASHVFPMGKVGSGCAAKLVNQTIHIANVAALGEGLALAKAQGLDMDRMLESLQWSSADSAMLRRFGHSIADEFFEPRFALALALKDLRFATETARANGLALFIAEEVKRRLEVLNEHGSGQRDFTLVTSWSTRRPE